MFHGTPRRRTHSLATPYIGLAVFVILLMNLYFNIKSVPFPSDNATQQTKLRHVKGSEGVELSERPLSDDRDRMTVLGKRFKTYAAMKGRDGIGLSERPAQGDRMTEFGKRLKTYATMKGRGGFGLSERPAQGDRMTELGHKKYVTVNPIPPPETVLASPNRLQVDYNTYFEPVLGEQMKILQIQRQSVKLVAASVKTLNVSVPDKPALRHDAGCGVDCKVGVPCEYKEDVDFRIVVLTFDRSESLAKCLKAISALHTMGRKVIVNIWIDRAKSGAVDAKTVEVAEAFQRSWLKGRVCVHIRERNAFVGGQWIDTWRPKPNTKEIALIVEDDVDISPYAYFWLRAVHDKFGGRADIAGYTLQMEHTFFFRGMGDFLTGPKNDSVFLYGVLGTWGYAPDPGRWRDFQDWYHAKNASVKPYVPDLVPTLWYQHAERIGTEATMWEMWHIYHSYLQRLSTVYCNLHASTGRHDVYLSLNRKEKGLHWSDEEQIHAEPNRTLLTQWNRQYVHFNKRTAKYEYNDTLVGYV